MFELIENLDAATLAGNSIQFIFFVFFLALIFRFGARINTKKVLK